MSDMMPMYGLVICLILVVLIIIPFWFIFSKAGYSKWLSLLMGVPIINVFMLYFLAFSAWPSQRET
jgi:type II secretory pathway component PulF